MLNNNKKVNLIINREIVNDKFAIQTSQENHQVIIEKFFEFLDIKNTKFIDKLPSEIGKIGEQITNEDLGIEKFNKDHEDLKIICQIVDLDDDEGIIKINITARIGIEEKSHTALIHGFNNLKYKKQKRINDSLKFVHDSKTQNIQQLPSQVAEIFQEITIERLKIIPFPREDQAIKIIYTVANAHDQDGILEIEAFASLGKINGKKRVQIFGFKTQFIQDLEDVTQFMSQFNDGRTKKHDKLPSQILGNEVNEFLLGIEKIDNFKKIKTDYEITHVSDDKGCLNVLIILTKNQVKQTKKIVITGFKKTFQQNEDDVEQLAKIEKNQAEEFLKTSKHRFLPSEIGKVNDILTKWDLGLEKSYLQAAIERGTKVTIKITAIDDYEGTINIELTLMIGKATRIVNRVITEYFTLAQKYQEEVNLLAQLFTTKQNTINNMTIPTWKNDQIVDKEVLGIFPPKYDSNAIEVTYTIIESNEQHGIVNANVQIVKTLSKPTTNGDDNQKNQWQLQASAQIEISNFKTRAMQDRDDVELLKLDFQTLETSLTHILPSNIGLGEKSSNNLGILKTQSINLNGAEIEKLVTKAVDDINGTIVLEIYWKKAQYQSISKGIITHYRTIALQNQLDVKTVIASITDLETTKNDLLPTWIVGATPSEEQLGIDNLITKNHTIITYKIKSVNQNDGTINVDMTVQKGNAIDSLNNLVITGFRTIEQQTTLDVEKVLVKIKDEKTAKIDILPSSINGMINIENLGIEEITENEGAAITYKIAENGANDDAGTLTVKVTVTKIIQATFFDEKIGQDKSNDQEKQLIVKDKTIVISHFKNTAQQHQEDVQIVIDNIKDTQTTLKDTLAVDIPSENADAKTLGIRPITSTTGANISYTNLAPKDAEGEIKVRIVVQQGRSIQQKAITITGYRTRARQDEIDLEAIQVAMPIDVTTSFINKLPEEI